MSGELLTGRQRIVFRGELVEVTRRNKVDVSGASSIEPESESPSQRGTRSAKLADESNGQSARRYCRIDQVAYDMEDGIGLIAHGRASSAGLPIDYVKALAVEQEVLRLEVTVQVHRGELIAGLKGILQVMPPGELPTATGELVEKEPAVGPERVAWVPPPP
ncbi:hypothetical protein AQI95_09420 [Streptomyces yokosukanensis]|uniref:Uncharacterized protein n=1 Tax=Streptomyces yokosukanensis TaxID=67386 RepID=A0A101PBR6_9ACTN|nr:MULTISPECIES: hypothetical protein [Streptomyces]KUN08565.1 hypothetical protein AQI95_09420 [Streptomyces yokosukanensis]